MNFYQPINLNSVLVQLKAACCFIVLLSVQDFYGQQGSFIMTQIGADHSLEFPWEITYGPDDRLWVTEREGTRISRIDPSTGQQDELIVITEAYQEERQDGLLGMALHPNLGKGMGQDYVYVSYTYWIGARRQKIVRYTYSISSGDGQLSQPRDILTGLPASNDHNSGRLVFGPDSMLYYTIGDQGSNQGKNKCKPVLSGILPTQAEIDQQDYQHYPGKILRMNLDGSIPADNPMLNGVRSHIYSYGHRNPQGLAFAQDGQLYSHEHGHKTDDEVNLIQAGKHYGWPHVAGYIDDLAYVYCDWSSVSNCDNKNYSSYSCPNGATTQSESSWSHPDFQPPLQSYFVVPNTYHFQDPNCDNSFICWPTLAPSSMDIYENMPQQIPGWDHSILLTSLKKGTIFQLKLNAKGIR